MRIKHLLIVALAVAILAPAAGAKELVRFAVNEYFGVAYDREPVSMDVDLVGRSIDGLRLVDGEGKPVRTQIEVLEGTPANATKIRVWTLVTFQPAEGEPLPAAKRHKEFTLVDDVAKTFDHPVEVEPEGEIGGIAVARLTTTGDGGFAAVVPVGGKRFEAPASGYDLPGPVVRVSPDGTAWVGAGYIDARARVKEVACELVEGEVFAESRIRYDFGGGRIYAVRVRMVPGKPYARLVEDFNLGGQARYVFNYEDWFADAQFRPGDHNLYNWAAITDKNPAGDFVQIPGQKCLARLVIWSQFNYFGGKQETIGLKAPDPEALDRAFKEAYERYQEKLAKYDRDMATYRERLAKYEETGKGKKPREPRKPSEPQKKDYKVIDAALDGAPYKATETITPGGDSLAVGGFYIRPDRWTRAKVNHVDLYMRPEVPGEAQTRGVVGLEGARARVAMEAWLVDGHREWAIFAVPSGHEEWLAKAHVQKGVWPLDRLNRLALVWNSDGSPVALEDTAPPGPPVGGVGTRVLRSTRGRAGLQTFNGSEGGIRGTRPPSSGWDGTVDEAMAADPETRKKMINTAVTAYMAADDSAYPSRRAMLPWTHPEAINPFYQGMENMNFNADLYRYVTTWGYRLAKMGHPEAMRFIRHGETSFDMALDRYVYPESGCWEESHGYASHTIHTVAPLVQFLANSGLTDFREDIRFARMVEFFIYVHSPVDPEFGTRVVPPIGDHGLSKKGPARRLGGIIDVFAGAKSKEVQDIVRRAAWMIRADGGKPPEGVRPEQPDLSSRWLRGYGAMMRGFGPAKGGMRLTLEGALAREDKKGKLARHDLVLTLAKDADGTWKPQVTGTAKTFNTAAASGTAAFADKGLLKDRQPEIDLEIDVGSDKWVKGGNAAYTVNLGAHSAGWMGTYKGTFDGRKVEGKAEAPINLNRDESFLVLRAGQSWGHHHADKGSMWFWGRNVHFFGDCDWGSPPGGTYWNKYKQGPASGTQIELVGINNWTLPCKYPAPYVSDDEYAGAEMAVIGEPYTLVDYANARCLYPFNPKVDLSDSTPVALRNGYDRQVVFVHPDLVFVRDNVETNCPTIWRLHSYQPDGTKAKGHRATLVSPQGPTGELAIVHPAEGVKLRTVRRDILNDKYHDDEGNPLPLDQRPKFKESVELRWDMPPGVNATWAFVVRGEKDKAPKIESLDPEGRVTRVTLADGTEVTALVNIRPFTFEGHGITFNGTVGVVVKRNGKVRVHPIRAETLEVR